MNVKKGNENLVELIHKLRAQKKPFWKKIANMLARPRTRKIQVNVSKIERYAKDGSTIVVPGKVLGDGRVTKKMKIAAFKFSESARKMISESGGEAVSLGELLDSKVEPKNILLLS